MRNPDKERYFCSGLPVAVGGTFKSCFFPYQIKFAFFMDVLKIICSSAQSYDYPGGKDRKIEKLRQPQVIKLALNG